MTKKCIVCDAPLMEPPLYVFSNMPASAQNLPRKDELEHDKPAVFRLCQCSGCGLVQYDCEPVPYYRDSTRAGERCKVLVELRQRQYQHLIETYKLQGKKILEVGAGKGGFLKTLKEMTEYHIQEYGIENNPEFVKIAREKEGVNVFQGFMGSPKMRLKEAPFDAFVSFAYPARLPEPNAMFRCIYNNLVDGGVGLVMVPSMEHLLEPGGFYDITNEHIAYYSQNTLRFLLQKNGFDVMEHGEVADIYIYAIVKKREIYRLEEKWADVAALTSKVRAFVYEKTKNGEKIAVWCAGHFTFTVLSVSQIGNKISYIIDNAEFKQNRYSPATHVPIYGAEKLTEEPVNTILILGPIYVDEIVNEIKTKCPYSVCIATVDKNGLRIC